jgi:hypothetical protein
VVRFKHSHPASAYTVCECLNQTTASKYQVASGAFGFDIRFTSER